MVKINSTNDETAKRTEALRKMKGYKFYRDHEDYIEMYRLLTVKGSKVAELLLLDPTTGQKSTRPVDFFKDFVPIQPDGFFTLNTVTVDSDNTKDVIVTVNKYLNMMVGDTYPFAICRQGITDFYYNLACADESDQIVGLSVNQNDCPANFDMKIMLACRKVDNTESCYFYRSDTLEDILDLVSTKNADKVLSHNYNEYIKISGDPSAAFRNNSKGWCNSVRELLKENNFYLDINEMLGIMDINLNIEDFIISKKLPDGEDYDSLNDEMITCLSYTTKNNITDITVLEYNHDINLGDFNNSQFFFIRDLNNKLYFCVFNSDNRYLEADMEAAYNQLSIADKWRKEFYDKYKNER